MKYPKIALLREGKVPPDSRVALTPRQVAALREQGIDIVVVPSENRIYKDEEYAALNIPLTTELSDRELLLGIKEVKINELVADKTYCFFAHVIKAQPYNHDLLMALLNKNIRHIDYEVMTGDKGRRLIAFGYYAGMVGAHNGIWAYGKRTGEFELPRMNECFDYAAAIEVYKKTEFPPFKVVLTGTGRVGKGAAKVLEDMGIRKVNPGAFKKETFDHPVYTQLECRDYVKRKDGGDFHKPDFYQNPTEYTSKFQSFTAVADIMINGIYWDNDAPAFFTKEEMAQDNFKIQTIADVTCDIAPVASIPSTLKASTIADPVFGYDPTTNEEVEPFNSNYVDVMSVDNLPSELPRDASEAFGQMFIDKILPEFKKTGSELLMRGTVTLNGDLGPSFEYLRDYKEGR